MNTSTHDAARVKIGVILHFVEVCEFDDIWTPVGAGRQLPRKACLPGLGAR